MTHHEEMKPAGAAVGSGAGGWWPRSLDPTTAFPELVSALHPWVGAVARITYNLSLWEPAQRKQTLDGRVIRYEGFHTIDRHAVTAIGTNARRVSLLVVPPGPGRYCGSPPGADSTATVADILASNGVPPQKRAPTDPTESDRGNPGAALGGRGPLRPQHRTTPNRVPKPRPIGNGFALPGISQTVEAEMLVLVVVLLAAWLIVSIVGFAMKGLMWLGIVGVVLFVGTAVIGAIRRKTLRRPSSTP